MTPIDLKRPNPTWAEFNQMVMNLLTVDAVRTGSGFEGFRAAQIRQVVIELQTLIDGYRINHESIYHPSDLVYEGQASRGTKPPQSVLRSVSMARVCKPNNVCAPTDKNNVPCNPRCERWPTVNYDYGDRMALIMGHQAVNGNRALFSIDPQGYTFYVYPAVYEGFMLSIFWDGLKLDFNDDEETPFDEATAGAVVSYLKAQIALEVERENGAELYKLRMEEYREKIPLLAYREREKSMMKGERT